MSTEQHKGAGLCCASIQISDRNLHLEFRGVELICTSIDFVSKAWYLLNCDWIIATFMLVLASVLNGIGYWLKTSLSSCRKFVYCARWLRRTALCRRQTSEWFKIFRSYFSILGIVIWSLCIYYVSSCWLMCRYDSGISQLPIRKLLEHEDECFTTEMNNTWSYTYFHCLCKPTSSRTHTAEFNNAWSLAFTAAIDLLLNDTVLRRTLPVTALQVVTLSGLGKIETGLLVQSL